jgi:hypothetical protein
MPTTSGQGIEEWLPAFRQRLEPLDIEETVLVPSADRASPARSIRVQVPAWRDPKDGEIYYDGDSLRRLDEARAHALALRQPPGRNSP